MMNIEDYLKKIGCENAKEVNYENLSKIRKGHAKTFSFENFDMHMGIPISFAVEDAYDRLMNQPRGGYCVQLNFVLGWALKELGYDMYFIPTYLYSRVFEAYNKWPVHVAIVVQLDGKKYYVEGGTSRFVSQPIEIVMDKLQKTKFGTYRFIDDPKRAGHVTLQRSKNVRDDKDLQFEDQIWFKAYEPKQMEDFRELNDYVQTVKHPNLFYRTYCSRQGDNNIYFLVGSKFTEVTFGDDYGETRVDKQVESIDEFREILKNKFGVVIENDHCRPVNNYPE